MNVRLSTFAKIHKCPECGSTLLKRYYEDDGIVCVNCGYVITNTGCTDCGSVIIANTAGRNPERKSGSKQRETNYKNAYMKTLTPYNRGFTTLNNRYYINGDLQKHDALNERLRNRLLEMWWKKAGVSDQTEKNLVLAFSEITKISHILSLPKSVLEKAATTYKKIVKKRYVKGRNIRTLTAATVYMACKQCGFPRTLNEVAIASKITKRKVGKGYRFLVKELGCFIPPVKPAQYLQKFLNQLTISEKTKEITDKILEAANVNVRLTSGRDPMSIVAAAIYIATLLTGEKKTQREIAEASRLTEATIRNRYKELAKHLLFIVAL